MEIRFPFVGIISCAVVLFTLAAVVGAICRKKSIWLLVDIVYYPLSTLGLVLLFINSSNQRRLFDLGQEAQNIQMEIQRSDTSRPALLLKTSEEDLGRSIASIRSISQTAKSCESESFASIQPECESAVLISDSLQNFLLISNGPYDSNESKVSSVCAAGDSLIEKIRHSQFNSTVTESLSDEYRGALSEQRTYSSLSDIEIRATKLRNRMYKDIDDFNKQWKTSDSYDPKYAPIVISLYYSEADVSVQVFQSLGPCLLAPRKDVNNSLVWVAAQQKLKGKLTSVEGEINKLKGESVTSKTIARFQLKSWPFILSFALALKFGKAVAATYDILAGWLAWIKGRINVAIVFLFRLVTSMKTSLKQRSRTLFRFKNKKRR